MRWTRTMAGQPRTPAPGRMRLLWIGNLVLAVVLVVLAATGDSWFTQILGLAPVAVTAVMARARLRQERAARRGAG
jgi:membrane protein implicated in regulation of membrane protease activity